MYVPPSERRAATVGGLLALAGVAWLGLVAAASSALGAQGGSGVHLGVLMLALAALCFAYPILRVVLHRRRRRRLPDLVLFEIAVNPEIVEDAPARCERIYAEMHKHCQAHPFAVYHVVEGAKPGEGKPYLFLLGFHRSVADKAERQIASRFDGRGASVRVVEQEDCPEFAPIFAAWQLADEEQSAQRAERDAAKERARAAAAHEYEGYDEREDEGPVRTRLRPADLRERHPVVVGAGAGSRDLFSELDDEHDDDAPELH
jgi:hypothetical protein